MNNIAVRCSDITKSFGRTLAIQGVSLALEEGKFLALLGPSGCGKTTLLRLIAGFEAPDRGTIEIGGRTVSGPGVFVPPESRRAGIVFQDYALFPHMDVNRNIAFGLPKNVDHRKRVQEMLSLVGLKGLEHRAPHELSGGEQQRVALARALAPGPTVLLLDEPFSNLDADLRIRIRAEVKDILTCAGATVVFVTHDQQEALFMGDLVGVMNAGRMEQIDTPQAIFEKPATPFVARFTGMADFLAGTVQDGLVVTEVGSLSLHDSIPQGERVSLMLRPNLVNIRPDPTGVGTIAERIFQGSHYLYRIKLPSGATVRSLQDCGCADYPVNTRVSVELNLDHNVVYFRESRQVCEPSDGEVTI
ncbi:MAG: ABC transporter ATP-binding protein [Chloroflexi bacterium]|nr:ABC transporter ATP-binding protein [Chloroflexota bacterium]